MGQAREVQQVACIAILSAGRETVGRIAATIQREVDVGRRVGEVNGKDIVAIAAEGLIVAARVDAVIAIAAKERVGAWPAGQRVCARAAIERIIARTTGNEIVA